MEINATFVGQAFAFLIFVVICMKYIWPPLMTALEKRQQEIAEGLSAAEKAKKSLEHATNNAKQTLHNAKVEAQKIIDDASKQRADIIDKAIAEATEEKNRIIQLANNEIEAEKNKAREELKQEVASLAVAVAEKILDAKIDKETDGALLQKVMEKL